MKKEDILFRLEKIATPIYQIEAELGMPKTTLQKAIKGERELPKKWAIKFNGVYPEPKISIQDLTNPTNLVEPITKKIESANRVINTENTKTPSNYMIELRRKKLGL